LPDFGKHHDLCTTDVLVDAFIAASREFQGDVELVHGAAAPLSLSDNIIFEGAQGLLLDQTQGAFPYVTRSNTGLQNVLDVATEADVGALDVIYVTRAYLTRHGAGPLANELPGRPYEGVVDITNQPNEYQGALRFADLDLDKLALAIGTDLAEAFGTRIHISARTAVTCLDQVGAAARVRLEGETHEVTPEELLSMVGGRVLPVAFGSWGPTRDTIVPCRNSLVVPAALAA
jgi:adenylosuccinate synthase